MVALSGFFANFAGQQKEVEIHERCTLLYPLLERRANSSTGIGSLFKILPEDGGNGQRIG